MSSYHSLMGDKIQSEGKKLKINESPDLDRNCVINNKNQTNMSSELSILTEENNQSDVVIIELDNNFESNCEKKKISDLNGEINFKNDKRIKTNSEQNERTGEKNINDEIIDLDNDNESNCEKKKISDLNGEINFNNDKRIKSNSEQNERTGEKNINDEIIELDNDNESNCEKKKISDLNGEINFNNDKRIKSNSEENEHTGEKNINDEIIELDNDNESNCEKKNISDLNGEINFKNNKGIKSNSEENQHTGEKDKSSDDIIILDNNYESNHEKKKIGDFNEECVLKNYEEMKIISEESQHISGINENDKETIKLDKCNESIDEKKKITDLIKEIKNGKIKTSNEQNKCTGEKTESDKNIYIIELVDRNEENIKTDHSKANNISILAPVKNNKKIVGKENIKLNLCRKRSDIYNEKSKEKNNKIIELYDDDDDDDKIKKLDTDIIEIDDEGDNEELYKDIIEAHCEDSNSDEGIVVIYDRNEADDNSKSSNKEIIDVDDDTDQDKNIIDKDQYKIQRLSEDICDEERQILQAKIYCEKDKTVKDMCSCLLVDGRWFYTCHPCNVKRVRWWDFLQHIQGNRHNNLDVQLSERLARRVMTGKNMKTLVKGGKSICEIDEDLDLNTITKPLVGLEYLLECGGPRYTYNQSQVTVNAYYCALCDTTKFNRRSIIAHLTSFQHYDIFLAKFFPTASEKIRSYIACKTGLVRVKFLEHVVGRIEYVHGRLQPSRTSMKSFQVRKSSLMKTIDECPLHIWETPEQTFAECVDEAHIDSAQCTVGWKNRQINNPKAKTSQPVFTFTNLKGSQDKNESINQMNSQASGLKWTSQIVQSVKPFDHRQNIQNENSPRDIELLDRFDEEEKSFYEKLISGQDPTLWEKYKQRIENIESEMIKDIDCYYENPEKHARFKQEMNKFWITRGKPKNIHYGYAKNNEFMQNWKIMLTELYQDMFKNEKSKLRKEFLDNYWHSKDVHHQSGSLLCAPNPPQWTDVDRNNFPREHKGGSYKRNHSPPKNNQNTYKRSKLNSNVSSTQTITKQPEDYKTRIIPVLRYISVLETHLGSLGSKILGLLSSALSLDKTKDITNILLNRKENCVLLETVKERLTGLLEANILDKSLITVTDNAIKKIESLLLPRDKTKFSTNMFSSSNHLQVNNRRDSKEYLKVAEISNFIEKHEKLSHLTFFQKTAITQQIGSVLINQNKLEINYEDLVLLIDDTVKQLNLPSKEENSLFQGYELKNSNQMDRYNSRRDYPSNNSASYSNFSRNHQNYQPKSKNFSRLNNGMNSISSGSKSASNDNPQSIPSFPFNNDFKSSYVPGHIPGYVPGYIPPYVRGYTPSQGYGHTIPYRQSFPRNHYTNTNSFRKFNI